MVKRYLRILTTTTLYFIDLWELSHIANIVSTILFLLLSKYLWKIVDKTVFSVFKFCWKYFRAGYSLRGLDVQRKFIVHNILYRIGFSANWVQGTITCTKIVNTFWFRSNVYHRMTSRPIHNSNMLHTQYYSVLGLLARSKCGFRIV